MVEGFVSLHTASVETDARLGIDDGSRRGQFDQYGDYRHQGSGYDDPYRRDRNIQEPAGHIAAAAPRDLIDQVLRSESKRQRCPDHVHMAILAIDGPVVRSGRTVSVGTPEHGSGGTRVESRVPDAG